MESFFYKAKYFLKTAPLLPKTFLCLINNSKKTKTVKDAVEIPINIGFTLARLA